LWCDGRHLPARGLPGWTGHFRTQHSWPGRGGWVYVSKIQPWRHLRVAEQTIDIKFQPSGSCLTTIEPCGRETPIIVTRNSILFEDADNAGCKNESPFIGNKCFFGQSSLPIRNDYQYYCENCDDD